MNTKNSKAYERLIKKFEALRVTLPDDERDIFDGIVTDEVKAHRMGVKAATKATTKSAEVRAHRMGVKAVTKATTKSAGKAAGKAAGK